MANDWAFSESMWMTDSRSGEPSEVDALSPDPWKIELGSTEELDNACGEERTLSSDDFSSMSLEQCQDLVGSVNTNSDNDTSNNLQFEVDQTYLSKLGQYIPINLSSRTQLNVLHNIVPGSTHW